VTETYRLGQTVGLRWEVRDEATGLLADPTGWSVTVASPSGSSTPTVDHPETGVFEVDFVPAVVGPHVAVFAATGEHAGVAEDVFVVTATSAELATFTVGQLRVYLGDVSDTDSTLLEALAAERVAQADRCRVDRYTEALREALLRRVARNLAARRVPVATFTSFEGGGTSTRVPSTDAEIARLEGPYRRWPVG
jgi:hypothetical protein